MVEYQRQNDWTFCITGEFKSQIDRIPLSKGLCARRKANPLRHEDNCRLATKLTKRLANVLSSVEQASSC